MAMLVYILAAFTSAACALLLLRGFLKGRKKLLLWSGLCFTALAVSNVLVFLDLVVIPDVDLYRLRLVTALVGMLMLLYGLIWESD